MSHHRVPFGLQVYEKSINSRCVLDKVSKVVSIERGGLCLSRNVFGFSNFHLWAELCHVKSGKSAKSLFQTGVGMIKWNAISFIIFIRVFSKPLYHLSFLSLSLLSWRKNALSFIIFIMIKMIKVIKMIKSFFIIFYSGLLFWQFYFR